MITNNAVYEQTYHILTNNVISWIMSYIKYRMSYTSNVYRICPLMPIYIYMSRSTISFPSYEGKETNLSTSSIVVWRETMEMTGSSWHARSSSCWGSSLTWADTKKVDMNQYLLYVEIKYMYNKINYFLTAIK